jgi:hypothetical protein
MVSKRRRSTRASAAGAGALGCGPFGFFLALAAIGLLIQYWWVLLIALGVITLTAALVHNARTPPATAPPPKPVRTPEPKALVNEDLAAQMRATKHVRHVRAMQEWDYEWIRLTYPEKSNRELSEIANAFFARGWSVGVNSEGPSDRRHNGPKPD